jgi:hypothetical protein
MVVPVQAGTNKSLSVALMFFWNVQNELQVHAFKLTTQYGCKTLHFHYYLQSYDES